MALHSFVDESKTPTYLLVAALIRPGNLWPARRLIRSLILPGQRRINFVNESDRRRAQILDRLVCLPIEVVLFEAGAKESDKARRDKCLSRLVHHHVDRDVRRLVLERDDSHAQADRQIVRRELIAVGAPDQLSYELVRAFEEPLLAVPDAVAWCWPRGGQWRAKAKQLVSDVYSA